MAREHRSHDLTQKNRESFPPVSDVQTLPRGALVAFWVELYERPPPANLSQTFLRRFLAFELQARANGPLPSSARGQLAKLASGKATPTKPVLKSGGRYLREWNGVTHVVEVTDRGHLYKGETFQSLSAVARAITGAHWSGPRFFGAPQHLSKNRSVIGRKPQ